MKEVYSRGGVLIGNVPDNWTVNKTLRCLDMPITDGPHETPNAVDEVVGIPFVSAEAVSCGKGSIDFEHIWGFISKDYYNECCKKYTPQIDDIYMIKSGATTGKVAIVNTKRLFTIWSPLAVFRANTFIIRPKYLFYFLQSPMYLSQVELGWNYGTQQNIGMRVLEQLYICYPSPAEQQQIVHFLDRKCTAIDTAIEKTKKSIEKLEEYKKAVITKAVTKGIDPNAKMKDSGVEWIGEIPENWSTPKVKYHALFFNGDRGKNYPGDDDLQSEGIPFITSNNLHELVLNTNPSISKYITNECYNRLGGAKIQLNDILFCLRGSVGICAINKELRDGTVASSLMDVRPVKIDADFLNYYFHSELANAQTIAYMNGSCAANLSAEAVSNYYLLLPDVTEQQQIVHFLDRKCTAIDTAIEKKKKAIEKWEEYKKSLIYYAVTGKIDCRNEAIE